MEKNKEIFDFENISNEKELTFNFNHNPFKFVFFKELYEKK